MKIAKNPYKPFSDYVLRTPLMSFNFLKTLTKNESIPTEYLKKTYQIPLVKEALFLASPPLYLEMEKWINGELDSKKEKKIKLTLLKYITRMSTRCTPFGLFAGCSLGSFSDRTQIVNKIPCQNMRHTRLDMNYLVALSQDLAKKEGINQQLRYFPNSSIYSSGHKLRYIEYYYINSKRYHQIVEVDNTSYLQDILQGAKNGARLKDLVQILLDDDISESESTSFIKELLENQVLISELEPSLSGPEFMEQILEILQETGNSDNEIYLLKKTDKELKVLDTIIGNSPKKYFDLSENLKKFTTSFELKYLFQTDLKLCPKKNELSWSIAESIQKGMVLLNQITLPSTNDNLNKFKQAFFERYEEREMALAKVLDVETGIGYVEDRRGGDVNPLVDNLVLPNPYNFYNTNTISTNRIDKILSDKLVACDKKRAQKIVLYDTDFEQFPIKWKDLPDTLYTIIELIQEDGIEKINFTGIAGPSAVNLLSRFGHADQALYSYTKNIADQEAKMNPQAILAEIIHLPEARLGNVLMRPSIREYEIPYLAKSVADTKNQIPLNDLYISVRNDKIILRSKKLNKQVIPRLGNAHNFYNNSLPVYHFLCDLQTPNRRSGLYFNFSPFDQRRSFLPRVEYDNLILHKAEWRIKKDEIQPLLDQKENTNSLRREKDKLCVRLNLPQYVQLGDVDNELMINFGNLNSVQMLLDVIKDRSEFILSEFLFSDFGVVKSTDGYHTNQLIISFFNENKLLLQKQENNG